MTEYEESIMRMASKVVGHIGVMTNAIVAYANAGNAASKAVQASHESALNSHEVAVSRVKDGWLVVDNTGETVHKQNGEPVVYYDEWLARVAAKSMNHGRVVTVQAYLEES